MATKFLEPGGDADFAVGATLNSFWPGAFTGPPTIVTDFVHGSHIKSIKYAPNTAQRMTTPNGVLAQAGGRISVYLYLNALPTATSSLISGVDGSGNNTFRIRITSTGVIQLWSSTAQIGSNGATLSTGQWYRISLAYTISSTIVNRFELFVDRASSISITNATIANIVVTAMLMGNPATDVTLDFRSSDHYIDNLTTLTDTGDIWVTAKRPNANGTVNNFNTQIGAGGSGYGTGHSPQVNERPLSTTNGWSIVGAGSAVTEEYNIEGVATGDINITGATIVDYVGWVSTKALAGETVNIVVNGVNLSQAITSTITLYTKVAGSSTYPAGTGADIGMTTDTSLTTVSLYECGIVVAYIPVVTNGNFLSIL